MCAALHLHATLSPAFAAGLPNSWRRSDFGAFPVLVTVLNATGALKGRRPRRLLPPSWRQSSLSFAVPCRFLVLESLGFKLRTVHKIMLHHLPSSPVLFSLPCPRPRCRRLHAIATAALYPRIHSLAGLSSTDPPVI